MIPASWRRRPAAWAVVAAGSAGALLLLSAVAPADASSPNPKVAVAQGVTLAGLHATPVFPVPSGTPETVSFALKMRNEGQLATKVDAGWHGRFLSVAQFAARFGQPEDRVKALETFLSFYRIKTRAYADHLVVTATGTAGEFNDALNVSQDEYRAAAIPARDGQAARPAVTFHGTVDRPLLPASIAGYVQSILGLTNYPIFGSSAVHAHVARPGGHAAALQLGTRTPGNFAREYGVTPLYKAGATGQGQTIGIVTFASVRKSDATHFWSKVLHIRTKANRISLDNVDGGSGPVADAAGSGETSLDLEQSGALAPDANVVVYQAPNSDYGNEDAYATVASQNKAGTVSCSWGQSETFLQVTAAAGQESATLAQAQDALLLELAAQGQSSFSTSGDQAAYDATGDLGTTNLAVDNAGDSPYTTTAGGTTIAGTIPLGTNVTATIKAERAWAWDWQWPFYRLFTNPNTGKPFASEADFAEADVTGSGGGYAQMEIRPSYQRLISNIGHFSAVPYLTPTSYAAQRGTKIVLPTQFSAWDATSGSATPPAVITGSSGGRAVPDLAANADPYTGYLLYFSKFASGPSLQPGWGGTSFVAPQLNGAAAVINSYLRHRTGLWNPAIYRFALLRTSPFRPVDATGGSNTNDYYTGTAHARYNPGTGLGVPDVAKLAADFRRFGG